MLILADKSCTYPTQPVKLPDIFRREFFKNVATLVSGTTFVQVIAIMIYPVLSRIYTPEDFGLFGLYMSIVSISAIVATGKYEMAVMLPKKDNDAFNLLGLLALLAIAISLLILLVIVFFNVPLSIMLGNEQIAPWLWFIPLSTLLVALFQGLKFYSNRHKKYKLITVANMGQSLTNSAGKVSIGPFVPGPSGMIAGTILGQLGGFLVFVVMVYKNIKGIRSGMSWTRMKQLAREYSLFPKYNMLQGVMNNFSSAIPVFVFNSYFTASIAGFYTIGYSLLYRPLSLVTIAFYQVLSQRIIEMNNREERIYPDIRKFLFRLLQLVVIPFILVAIFAPVIFRVVLGPEWEEAGRYTQIIVPWLFVTSLTMPLSFIPDMFRRQRKAMILDAVKFALRITAMIIGVIHQDVYLGLLLFSLSSTFMIMYSLLWYISMVRKKDKTRI
ncbi:MAG: oligosaccharide flippase family protein [Bacteroidales bacterium]|nr:oligosaccharide flippase family protein [Bacteroidales bacterium]